MKGKVKHTVQSHNIKLTFSRFNERAHVKVGEQIPQFYTVV